MVSVRVYSPGAKASMRWGSSPDTHRSTAVPEESVTVSVAPGTSGPPVTSTLETSTLVGSSATVTR